MPDPIVYVDKSRIREGRLDELKVAIKKLAEFIEEKNPRVISYRFFLNEEETSMTVVAVHPDSAALELHMDVGAAEFGKFADLVEVSSITVYGEVSDAVRERLHQKARMLGRGAVAVRHAQAGFAR